MTERESVTSIQRHQLQSCDLADWLAKLDRGHLTTAEKQALHEWLQQSEQRYQALTEAATLWYGIDEPLTELLKQTQHTTAAKSSRLTWRNWAVAASLLLVVVFAWMSWPTTQSQVETGYFASQVGQSRSIQLSDGSQITLNTNSVVEQAYTDEERTVRLIAGEAFFEVAKDHQRPFVVYAADGVIRAVGTAFNVRIMPERVAVTVSEGVVSIAQRTGQDVVRDQPSDQSKEPLRLTQGEAGDLNLGVGVHKRQLETTEVDERTRWLSGELVFYDKPVSEVIAELSRYTPTTIRILDGQLAQRKITGVLQLGDVERLLEGIQMALDVRVERPNTNTVLLRPNTTSTNGSE